MGFKNGFTLIEVMLAVSLVAVTAAFVFPLGINQLQQNRVEQNLAKIISQMKELQQRALSEETDYGIAFLQTGEYAIFEGSDYASATQIQTEELDATVNLLEATFSDDSSEIVFEGGSLQTSATGELVFGSDINNYTITINNEGLIDFFQN